MHVQVSESSSTTSAGPPKDNTKIGGIDRRLVFIVVVFLILILPIFPVEETVAGTPDIRYSTITNYSVQLYTVTQPTSQDITVVVGSGKTVPTNNGGGGNNICEMNPWACCYWDPYYGYVCGYYQQGGSYSGGYFGSQNGGQWYYGQGGVYGRNACNQWGTGTFTVDVSDKIVRFDVVDEAGGTHTVTLTGFDGRTQVIRGVCSYSLTYTGVATVQTSVAVIETNSVPNLQVSTQQVPTTIVITKHKSILQILLGY